MIKTINTARTYGLMFTFPCIIVFEAFADGISWLFIKDTETIALTTDFLRIMRLATPLTICNFHICYTLQAMGKGTASLELSACRQGFFNIPLLFLMNRWFGLHGIIWTQLIADTLTVILSLFIYRRTLPKPEQAQLTG